jgi:TonB dependent receptor.
MLQVPIRGWLMV